mgnify:CR=1 FL=1
MINSSRGKNQVVVASVQMDVVYDDVNDTVSRVCDWIEKAATEKADIVLFPELVLSGGYALKEKFYKVAETVPGPSTEQVAAEARKHGLYVIVGLAERTELDVLYDSAVLINRNGEIQGVYRKTHIFPPTESVFSPGNELPVFETDFGRIGILICYDLEFPETARVMALCGARILFHLVADWPQGVPGTPERLFETSFPARALENRIAVVISNRVGKDPDLKSSFYGLSRIIGVQGEVIAEAGGDEEMITAKLVLSDMRYEREKYNYFRDRKPHLYEVISRPVS